MRVPVVLVFLGIIILVGCGRIYGLSPDLVLKVGEGETEHVGEVWVLHLVLEAVGTETYWD